MLDIHSARNIKSIEIIVKVLLSHHTVGDSIGPWQRNEFIFKTY